MSDARRKDQYVVPHGRGWAVYRQGSARRTSKHPTRGDAIAAARQIARNRRSRVFVNDRQIADYT